MTLLLLLGLAGCGAAVRGISPPPRVAAAAPRPAVVDHEARRLYLLGQIHHLHGDLEQARIALEQAARHDRSSPWILLARGDVQLEAGDLALARELWTRAVELDSECGPGWLRLARLERVSGDLPAAREAYLRSIVGGEGWKARAELVELLHLLGDHEQAAVAVMAWSLSEQPMVPRGLLARAEARLSVEDRQGAWEDLRRYLLERPDDLLAMDLFLLVGDGLGRPGAAMEVVESASLALPADPGMALRAAAFYESIGHPLRFLDAVDRILRLTEEVDPRLHQDRARALLRLDRPAEALEALDDLEATGGSDWPRLPLLRAEALLQAGRRDESRRLLAETPVRVGTIPLRARLLRELGEEDAAGELLRQALVDAPDQRPLLEAALAHAAATGDAGWGLELARELATDAEGRWLVALSRAGRSDEARALLERRASTGDPEAGRDLAAARIAEEPAAAVASLRQLCPALPADRRCRFLLAAALVELGLQRASPEVLDEARRVGAALLSERSGDPRLLNLLAWSHAEGGDALDQGLPLAREAVSLDPADPHYLDTLGWLLARMGRLDRARPLLEEAAALAPDSEEIASHLAAVRSGVLPPPALAPVLQGAP